MNELKFYKNALIAVPDFHQFQLCGLLENGERWPVVGEIGHDWTEIHEVGTYFNAEGDGAFYYVGDENLEPLRPSYDEVGEVVQHCLKFKLPFSYSEKLAIRLVLGE